jgi:Dolichyl-phosphate-mannose-protein mannosyltransferase
MTHERSNPRQQIVGLGVILILFGLLVAWANPIRNFPMGDDWEYARTVQRLITTGQFYRSPVVQATAFFPALWGALFSAVLGFSFTTLRISTLPLAAGTLVAFYLVLGELDFKPALRPLGTLTLMVAPLFVFNALSFMTDVPFLFWFVLGWWCSLRAFKLGSSRWLLAGSVCAAVAFLTRQLGLAQVAAVVVVVLLYRPRTDWPRWLAASAVVPVLATLIFFGWQYLARQTTWADSAITDRGTLQFIFNPQLPTALARRIVVILVTLNLYMAPLWIAFLPQTKRAWSAIGTLSTRLRVTAILLIIFFFGSVTYFGLRNDWWPYSRGSLSNAGLWPSLAFNAYPNDVRPPFFPEALWIGLTYIGAACAVMLTLNLVSRLVTALRERSGFPLNLHQNIAPARALTYLNLLAVLSLLLVFPLFFERYFLPLLPGLIILLLEATPTLKPSWAFGAVALVAVGVFSVGLMWDYWDWHAVRWQQTQALVDQGVPLDKIDAGYEWTGWQLSGEAYSYIRAHNAPLTNVPVQYVIDPEYMVTFTPQPGYTVAQTWPFYSPFRPNGADALLLLKRLPPIGLHPD